MHVMKRYSVALLCASVLLVLSGCDVLNFLWQGIIGKGYYQLTQASVAAESTSMTNAPIDLSTLTTSSVIVYKTSANGLYGKLSLLTAPPTGSLTIMFVTYKADGTTKQSSTSVIIPAAGAFDLEGGIQTAQGNSDFVFSSPATLTPENFAKFYLMP